MYQFLIILSGLSVLATSVKGQTIEGLWEIREVRVGEELMTPVAKWYYFDEDGVVTGGNGETRNFNGLYEYDFDASTLKLFDAEGNPDPMGAFSLQQTGWGELLLRREEMGDNVAVQLVGISTIPKAPWDLLVGMWQQSETNKAFPKRIFFRWDREYRCFQDNQLIASGIWHVNAHFPELRMLSNTGDSEDTKWMITFSEDGNTLTLKGEEEVISYTRQPMD